MTTCFRSGLALGLLVFVLAPPATAPSWRADEAWPDLLSQEPASDPALAQLHERAAAALERLVQLEQTSQWRLHLAESRSDGETIITEH